MAILHVNFTSESLMRNVSFNVILPIENTLKNTQPKPFRTLYLLHGVFGNYQDWVSKTRILRWADDQNIAVVMPSGDNSFYIDLETQTGDRYGEFIGQELVEVTRRLFPLSTKREDTFIGGLSMGGYGALRNGLKYHETFGAIIALSAALIIEDMASKRLRRRVAHVELIFNDLKKTLHTDINPKFIIQELIKNPKTKFPRLYLACGLKDPLLESNRNFVAFLTSHNIEFTYHEDAGQHDWDYWDKHIKKALLWLKSSNSSIKESKKKAE